MSFHPSRPKGIMFAVIANMCYAVGNVAASVYPSTGPLFLWRGTGAAAVTSVRGLYFSRKALFLGAFHTAHMLCFIGSIRVGPAWLAPAVLGAAPAILWFWDRLHSWKVDAAVVVMAASAFVFAWTPGTQISFAAFILAVLATVFVAVRMRFAVRWVGAYDANTALVIAYVGQAIFGLVYCVVTGDWQFVLGLVVLMVAVSSVGHRMLYASARHCTPTIAAALNPLSVVITAAGVVLVGGAAPSVPQIAVGCVWLLSGVFVSLTATNTVKNKKL